MIVHKTIVTQLQVGFFLLDLHSVQIYHSFPTPFPTVPLYLKFPSFWSRGFLSSLSFLSVLISVQRILRNAAGDLFSRYYTFAENLLSFYCLLVDKGPPPHPASSLSTPGHTHSPFLVPARHRAGSPQALGSYIPHPWPVRISRDWPFLREGLSG